MAWITLSSVSVDTGSTTVNITGGYDLSSIMKGWSLDIGSSRAEIKSGTEADEYGACTITLVEAWRFASVTDQLGMIVPIPSRLNEAIRETEDLNAYALDVNTKLKAFTANDEDISVTLPDQTVITYPTMRKSSRLFDEFMTASSTTFNDKLAEIQTVKDAADATLAVAQSAQQVWDSFGGLDQINTNVDTWKQGIEDSLDSRIETANAQTYDGFYQASVNAMNTQITLVKQASAQMSLSERIRLLEKNA